MARGLKFWHGDMVAKPIFPLENNFTQDKGKSQGICTAASLAWCKACLKAGRGVNTWAEIGMSEHNLNIVMATLRQYDGNPVAQTEMAGLESLGEQTVGSVEEMMLAVEASPSKIGIFWTSYHTMGYRYSHLEKDFFDMNEGLFRAKYTAGIKAKVDESYPGEIIGCRIVGL